MHLSALTDAAALAAVAQRLTAHRLACNLSQDELAARAGVGRSTVQRLERGESIQLGSFIKLLRALDRLDALGEVLPAPTPSPLTLLAAAEQMAPRRARSARPQAAAPPPVSPPQWGDETGDAG